jgi:mRNA-degrading endonuclease HigB of HigAB toxin-antitoxin module
MICACDRDELFEREQYKNQFALLSDDGFNVFAEEFDLSKEAESTGYVVVGCGGAHEIEQEARVDMVEDLNLLFKYNRTNYDTDESKYAQKLSADKYSIDNYRITVQAGQRTGRMPIKVRADGLSPDSIYFIPLKVQTFSAYEFHPQKATILYRVLLKNYWATQKTVTSYALRGVRNSVNVMGTKQVFPVSGNKVRIMAGNETFASNTNTINAGSITLEIAEDGHVTITPWKEINVTQIDDDPLYPNTFTIEDTGFNYYKTFLLRYNYVFNGTTYQMQEELRLEFNPQKEK